MNMPEQNVQYTHAPITLTNPQPYITILTNPNQTVFSKTIELDDDGNYSKKAGIMAGQCIAMTIRVNNIVLELPTILHSLTPYQSIIYGWVPGTETNVPYTLYSAANCSHIGGAQSTGIYTDDKGFQHVRWAKDNFQFSTLTMFDVDVPASIPSELKHKDLEDWLIKMDLVYPNFSSLTRVVYESSSNRIVRSDDGSKVFASGSENFHIVINTLPNLTDDRDRWRHGLTILADKAGMTYQETFSDGMRTKPISIWDPVVLTSAQRVSYDAEPFIAPNLQSELKCNPLTIKTFSGNFFDTSIIPSADAADIKAINQKFNTHIQASSSGQSHSLFQTEATLRLDQIIQTQYDGNKTVLELIEMTSPLLDSTSISSSSLSSQSTVTTRKKSTKVRCQADWRQSTSWNAYFDLHRDGNPLVYDQGRDVKYVLNESERMELHEYISSKRIETYQENKEFEKELQASLSATALTSANKNNTKSFNQNNESRLLNNPLTATESNKFNNPADTNEAAPEKNSNAHTESSQIKNRAGSMSQANEPKKIKPETTVTQTTENTTTSSSSENNGNSSDDSDSSSDDSKDSKVANKKQQQAQIDLTNLHEESPEEELYLYLESQNTSILKQSRAIKNISKRTGMNVSDTKAFWDEQRVSHGQDRIFTKAPIGTTLGGANGNNKAQSINNFLKMKYCFLKDSGRFFDLFTQVSMTPTSFNQTEVEEVIQTANGPRTIFANQIFKNQNGQVADGLTWMPVKPGAATNDYISYGNSTLCNTYRRPHPALDLKPEPDLMGPPDVKPFLEHIEYLIPDEKIRNVLLDHIAYAIQHPDKKCQWQIVWVGKTRIGKDMLFTPLSWYFGDMYQDIDPHEKEQLKWGDTYAKKKIIVYQEIHRPGDREFTNSLKTKAASTGSGRTSYNLKGGAILSQENLLAMYMMSNFEIPIHIDHDDGRYFVISSMEVVQRDKDYYTNLIHWFQDNDNYGSSQVIQWLMNRDLSQFNPGRLPFNTAAKDHIIKGGCSDIMQTALDDLIREKGIFNSTIPILSLSMITDYLRMKLKRKINRHILNQEMHHLEAAGLKKMDKRSKLKANKKKGMPEFRSTLWRNPNYEGDYTEKDLQDSVKLWDIQKECDLKVEGQLLEVKLGI